MAKSTHKSDFLQSNALNELFLKIPKDEIRQIAQEVQAECIKNGVTYVDDDGVARVIPLMLRPRIINPIQRSYFHYVCLQLVDALKKAAGVYIRDPQVRKLLPISE